MARKETLTGLTFNMVSLGCAKNWVDAEVMIGLLEAAGARLTPSPSRAQVLIINTCGFIAAAQEESVDRILELAQWCEKSKAKALIVTGCLAQRFAQELFHELPEVDAIVGTGEFYRLPEIVTRVLAGERLIAVDHPLFLYDETWPRRVVTPSHYAYIKIAEGCSNCCSYCVIPQIRGSFRSRTLPSIIAEAQKLEKLGLKEIILVAQDTTRYGEDIYGGPVLAKLLQDLIAATEIPWIRWMYGYPNRITSELITVMATHSRICPYVDLPLQHIHPEILKRMHRPVLEDKIYQLIEELRRNIPNAVLRTTFIVGFPGETEKHFSFLLEFLKKVKFDRVGAFVYSPEAGTPAAEMDHQVPEEIKHERYHRLMQTQQEISLQANRRWEGEIKTVLVEGFCKPENTSLPPAVWKPFGNLQKVARGRSQHEAPEVDGQIYFYVPPTSRLKIGEFVPVEIIAADYYDLVGVAKI